MIEETVRALMTLLCERVEKNSVLNALGVDVNVGGRGRLGEGNYLCENQLNPVCVFEDTGSVHCGSCAKILFLL